MTPAELIADLDECIEKDFYFEIGRADCITLKGMLPPPSPCGCTGFLHANSCSDQNPIDPLGSILNPEHRAAVRRMLPACFRREREMTDAFINAIGEASVAEIQLAIAKWRAEHDPR